MATPMKLRSLVRVSQHLPKILNCRFHKRYSDPQYAQHLVIGAGYRRCFSSEPAAQTNEYHNIITDSEKATGEASKYEFQSETQMLLEIVAKSLYSDKEVFIRELISNASDALEKLRYVVSTNADMHGTTGDHKLEIHIATDKISRTITIQDTGIGMTRKELVSNLGTIARSGSKAFLEQLKEKQDGSDPSKIIGQFGVGFYSAFMVANKVEVFTKSYTEGAESLCWSSDGSGVYQISTAEGVQSGTKIVIHLKPDCREFSDENVVKGIIKKYSNFVGSPIFINGARANTILPLWMMEPRDISPLQHNEFYRFIGNCLDSPRFILHYKTDAPISIRALLYFPESRPALFDLARDTSSGIALYSRKILIKNKVENLLPKWLRFVKGVVDSEDIPLNLSRELLQNSALINKLRSVLTARVLKFLQDQAKKNPEGYHQFYRDYSVFLKEGIMIGSAQNEKEEIGKLLRFESSAEPEGRLISLNDYCSRLPEKQKNIYYLSAPNRALAEQSPYYEALKKRNVEVLFCYEGYDEIILVNLAQFQKRFLTSVEKEMRDDREATKSENLGIINQQEMDDMISHMRTVLSKKAHDITMTNRLQSHPCVVTVADMTSARHFIRTQSNQLDEEMRYSLLQPRFEINPNHPLIKKLCQIYKTDRELADLIIKQLFNSAMVGAGLIEDSRILLSPMNDILTKALEKY